MPGPRPRSVGLAAVLFRRLTGLMPRDYRERHRDEAVDLMTRLLGEAHRRSGALAVLAVAASALLDLLMRLPAEHFASWRLRAALDALRLDVRCALRSLRRHPASSGAAATTLALGLGLNAAVFSVFDWVLLRPLPYPAPRELVRVFSGGAASVSGPSDLTYSEYSTFSRAPSFRASAAFSMATRVIGGPGVEAAHVVVARVAGDLFATLGVSPDVGRGLDRNDAASGAAVVVVSDRLWRARFAGDPSIAGRLITIDRQPHTVVGVMPAGRGYPSHADLWRPLTAGEREDDDRENAMIARLAGQSSAERAGQELAALARQASKGARRAWVEDVHLTEVRDVRGALTALLASAWLILLMTCANVAALLGARAAERSGELAVRGALGASRPRLARQLLTESLLLAAAAGTAGVVLGRWALDLLVVLAPAGLPRLAEITLDGRVIAAGAGATLLLGVSAGVAPAYRASRLDLRAGLGTASGGRATARSRGRSWLVAAQAAMAVVLTVSAGLFTRSLQQLLAVEHGFAPDRLLAIELYMRGGIGGDVRELSRSLIETAEAVPGVRSAAVALRLPTDVAGLRASVRVQGDSTPAPLTATLRPITPRYFETAGIPLTHGRAFGDTDRRKAPLVAIVNSRFVRDILRGRPAIDTRLSIDLAEGTLTVVGAVGDVTPGGESDRAALYVPLDQIAIAGGSLLVRTEGQPRAVLPVLTARLQAVATGLPLDRIHSLTDTVETGRSVTRFNMRLASAFSGLALLLAAIGTYGLTAGEVAARWREIAIRIALGAPRRDTLWTVLRPGARALALGSVLGLLATLAVGRSMASLLHGIQPADPTSLLLAPALLGAIGVAAGMSAAARVLRADAAATLRRE